MDSKIHTIVISSILAFSLIAGIPTVFAQNDTMSMDNSTSSMMNATLPTSVMNATVAFAQENDTSEGGDMGMTQDGNMTQSQGGDIGMSEDQGEDNGDDEDKDNGNW